MSSTEPVTVVVRSGRSGRYADWRVIPDCALWWQRQALCGSVVGEVFFAADEECPPVRHHRERVAKAICAACPVRQPCGPYALVHRELHGVWGGLSETDRRRRLART